MEKHRAIPKGYMKVGELAKKAGITTRTLRFYDKEGLLPPSHESEGGYRLYTNKDMARLVQIITMKQLGLTIEEIKKRLVSIDTPADMVNALTEHADSIRQKIESLTNSLKAIEALKAEVIQMETVDFQKYSAILLNLQMNNEYYWVIKHVDEEMLEKFRTIFDDENAAEVIKQINLIHNEAAQLEKKGIAPDSSEGKALAQKNWDLIQNITNGDNDMINKLIKVAEESSEHLQNYEFIKQAMHAYFTDKEGEL